MISDINSHLLLRKTAHPQHQLLMESKYVSTEDLVYYRAYISNIYSGEWKADIEDALESLADLLNTLGEVT